ncbi:MAG: hypothetical protein ACREC0_13905 [Methylocella sp.]
MPSSWQRLEAELITPLLIDPNRIPKRRQDGSFESLLCPSAALYFDTLVTEKLAKAIDQRGIEKAHGDVYLFMRAGIVCAAKNSEIADQIWKLKREIVKSSLPTKIRV